MYSCRFETPLGEMLAAANENKIIGLWFTSQKHFPKDIEQWEVNDAYPVFDLLRHWLKAYFQGATTSLDLPLEPQGTDFQKLVWRFLLEIPYGETATYGEVARKVANAMNKPSMSAQAVGGAIGRNPISIVIPCHRVIGANRSLTGYDGGLDKKEALLKLESTGKL